MPAPSHASPPPPPPPHPADEWSVVAVHGSPGLSTLPKLRRTLLPPLADGAADRLVVDLSAVAHCDVRLLALLVATDRRARSRGGALRVVATGPAVLGALDRSGLARILAVHPDIGSATEHAPARTAHG
ncbi:STAS domain-containing protein [Streptomyces sp. NPDC054796]